jgi:hypothetical protein
MDDFLGLAIGLLVIGLAISLVGRSIMPFIVVGVVIWAGFHFYDGLTGGADVELGHCDGLRRD